MIRPTSLIARGSALLVSTAVLGVPTLPCSTWYSSSGLVPVTHRIRDAMRTAVLGGRWPS